MSNSNEDKMKQLIADKKAKRGFLDREKKIGSGKVEIQNKSMGHKATRTKKISQ